MHVEAYAQEQGEWTYRAGIDRNSTYWIPTKRACVAGVAGTKIQNQSSTLRKNQELEIEVHLLRSARPATTASNAINTPMTAQAGVVSTIYVCVTVVTEVCVAATVVGVIT